MSIYTSSILNSNKHRSQPLDNSFNSFLFPVDDDKDKECCRIWEQWGKEQEVQVKLLNGPSQSAADRLGVITKEALLKFVNTTEPKTPKGYIESLAADMKRIVAEKLPDGVINRKYSAACCVINDAVADAIEELKKQGRI